MFLSFICSITLSLGGQYGNCPSESTICEWLDRFSKIAISKAKEYQPDVGDIWITDETVLKIGVKETKIPFLD